MSEPVDLYSAYGHFTEQVLESIRKETYGEDIGQNSWLTSNEYRRFLSWLNLESHHHVLEVASGSGGPASFLANEFGCHVIGIDVNESGIAEATQAAIRSNQGHLLSFQLANANERLPFAADTFDALVCIDAMNHFPNRPGVLQEWQRVLRPGGRALFTDPVVITGPVTNEELALRSSIGLFLFVPPGVNERLIGNAGFQLVLQEDVTENAALTSGRWRDARQRHRDALVNMEGEERFEGLQKFFDSVHRLTSERRLSRIAYLLEKPVGS